MPKEKNLELERLVFFSDAVVAIAITLLALDLRVDKTEIQSILSFRDLGHLWPKFLAFFLSFLLIAVFWKVHHEFFSFIRKIDGTIFWNDIFWLLFIITLPFSTTLVSSYFGQTASVFVYSLNTLLITMFQNNIWDYVAVRPDYLNERADPQTVRNFRIDCNVAMVNAVIATIFSFISPTIAFLILFTRPIMMTITKKFFRTSSTKENEPPRKITE